jgi:hypothetical protein
MASSQVARREVKVARVLSRMPTIMAAVSRILRLGPAEYAGPFYSYFWAGDDLLMRYVPSSNTQFFASYPGSPP